MVCFYQLNNYMQYFLFKEGRYKQIFRSINMDKTEFLNTFDESPERLEMTDKSMLRWIADSTGYDNYTYEDIIGLWKEKYNNTTSSISNYFTNINLFNACSSCIENTTDAIIEVSQGIESAIERKIMHDTNEMAEIADNIRIRTTQDKMRNTEVKIQLNLDKCITSIMIKRRGDSNYVEVPYEKVDNPIYIQNILDMWFDQELHAAPSLFKALSKYYSSSRRNKPPNWFESHTEWVKFSYIQGCMQPCGYKRYKNMDEEISESYETL